MQQASGPCLVVPGGDRGSGGFRGGLRSSGDRDQALTAWDELARFRDQAG